MFISANRRSCPSFPWAMDFPMASPGPPLDVARVPLLLGGLRNKRAYSSNTREWNCWLGILDLRPLWLVSVWQKSKKKRPKKEPSLPQKEMARPFVPPDVLRHPWGRCNNPPPPNHRDVGGHLGFSSPHRGLLNWV